MTRLPHAAIISLPDPGAVLPPHHRIVGVGLDVVDLDEVGASLERFGSRYAERVFSDRERRYCAARSEPLVELAARYAVKEGVFKALGAVDPQPDWRHIETLGAANEWHRPVLSGRAARYARDLGASWVLAGISSDDRLAGVLVLAVGGDPPPVSPHPA
ncbi:MAG: holo-ACP synthase [Acidobacteriota bacterium]|nr:holo-ACP synthase [Acidobacteriota bacterium]